MATVTRQEISYVDFGKTHVAPNFTAYVDTARFLQLGGKLFFAVY